MLDGRLEREIQQDAVKIRKSRKKINSIILHKEAVEVEITVVPNNCERFFAVYNSC